MERMLPIRVASVLITKNIRCELDIQKNNVSNRPEAILACSAKSTKQHEVRITRVDALKQKKMSLRSYTFFL